MKKSILFILSILMGISMISCESSQVENVLKNTDPVNIFAYGEDEKVTFLWEKPEGAKTVYIGRKKGGTVDYIGLDSELCTYTEKKLINEKKYTYYVYAEDDLGKKTFPTTIEVSPSTLDPCLRIMAYFKDSAGTLEEQSLYLALTTNGLNWVPLNKNNPIFTLSKIGGNRIRDPYIVKKADGTYLMIATDWTLYKSPQKTYTYTREDGTTGVWNYTTESYWDVNTSSLIFADSEDLIHWKNERQIQMVSNAQKESFYEKYKSMNSGNGNYMFCWAPEVIFDTDENGKAKVIHTDEFGTEYYYGVIWSGNGELDGPTNEHNFGYRRTFVNWTNDFYNFSSPQVYFDPGYSQIDASVISDDGEFNEDGSKNYYLFYKDEGPNGNYGLAMNKATSLEIGAFDSGHVFNKNFGKKIQIQDSAYNYDTSKTYYNQGEGAFAFRPHANKKLWYVYLDAHDAHKEKIFACYSTEDFEVFTEEYDDLTSFPSGAIRHGCSVPITKQEIIKVLKNYGI